MALPVAVGANRRTTVQVSPPATGAVVQVPPVTVSTPSGAPTTVAFATVTGESPMFVTVRVRVAAVPAGWSPKRTGPSATRPVAILPSTENLSARPRDVLPFLTS